MSGSSDGEEPVALSEALRDLHDYLRETYPPRLAQEIFDAVEKRTREIARGSPNIVIGAIDDFRGKLAELHQKGALGIANAELISADLMIHAETVRRRVLLRFFKHYLEDEEYKALLTAYQLRRILSNPDQTIDPPGMVRGLYKRRDSLRYGRQIYNQLSSGNLEALIYPEMRRIETQLVPAGRVRGPERERVKQVFYGALRPDPSVFWVNDTMTGPELFDIIHQRLVDEGRAGLTLYGARGAWDLVQEVSRRFVDYNFPGFVREIDEDEANPLVGRVTITRGEAD